jgi:hypothetical protein
LIIDGYNGLVVKDVIQDKVRIKAFLATLSDNQNAYSQRAKRMNQIFSVERLSQEQLAGMRAVLNQ